MTMKDNRQCVHLGGISPNSVVRLQITLMYVRRDYLLKYNLQIRNFRALLQAHIKG